ncbi:hypothetical protein CRYUN_Cryun15aG0047800 [Craigia yunnanensis]
MSSSSTLLLSILLLSLFIFTLITPSEGNFNQNFDITWGGDQRAKILNGGQLLTLSLDKDSGSGFLSKHEYLFGRIDMQIKLVANNSAGTVTTYYLSSEGPDHDEIDFEFLGNLSGDPYILHTYSIVWNRQRIIMINYKFSYNIFAIPISDSWLITFMESIGVPFPSNQPMRIYSSLWNADDWATRGGLVKTDWTQAPFTASYRNFNANACIWSASQSSCASESTNSLQANWQDQTLDAAGRNRIRWVQNKFMVYNYCTDLKRFSQGLPPECKRSRFL